MNKLYEIEDKKLHHNLCKRAVTKTNTTAPAWIQAFYKETQDKREEEEEGYFQYF